MMKSPSAWLTWALFAGAVLHAQSITLAPLSPSVAAGGTVQFTATTSGNTGSLTWYAGGVAGGNSTVGTISGAGLYKAPAVVPSPSSVSIICTGTSSSVQARTTVNILPAPPALTAVSPNPLSSGTITVTLTGSGFQSGALLYVTAGSNTNVQYAASSVTATSLAATIYLGPVTSAVFSAKNPGSGYSNGITVPVTAPGSGGGTGGGSGSGGSGTGGSGSGGGSSAPVLTAVAPNPIPAGTVTVTLTGSGFQSGALLYVTAGSNTNVQYAASSVTATSLTASIYLGPVTSAVFSAKNPGSGYSNSLTVPVTAASSGGGSGSGGGGGSGSGGGSSAPVLTSVAPNPIPAGTVTVTLTGTGFQSSALLYVTAGGNTNIQYAPNSVTATSLTAGIYLGSVTSATFSAKNPGSGYSNSLTVPVTAASSGGGSGSGGSGGGSGNYTLTVVGGTVNGSNSGSFAAGTQVTVVANAAPAGQVFQFWSGASFANAAATTTTLNMPAANTTATANFVAPAPIPFPVTTHPRLWITQQDLPRLESWAIQSNVTYQGLTAVLNTVIGNYHQAFPGAALSATNPAPANPYPDFGDTQGYTGMLTEENAVILALQSLIDPNPANRPQYAQAARNLLMYAMNQAVQGQAVGMPFRDPAFPIYNRGSFSGHEWPLIVDWIYNATANGVPILTAADKATIRKVFMTWAGDCLAASTTGGDNPGPAGLVNNLALLPGNQPYRMASNNYYLAHARLLTMMSLALDPADDPPVVPGVPAAVLGNSLRSYIADANGAWLYEEFAMMGDPQVVAQAYNVPNNPTGAGFGLASGGLPPEGMLYGESFAYVLGQLLALETAGFNNLNLAGPQIGLIGAPVWDRYVTGYISSLTPTPKVPPSETYDGAVYQYDGYGDMLRLWVTPDQMAPWGLLGMLDMERGIATHLSPARWFVVNAMPNGAGGLLARMANPWTWGVTQDLLYYMLLDPAAAPAPDPRPTFPLLFYDAPAARIVAHSDWTVNGTMFDYRASWISINHQNGAGGLFELFRKGEWLTKEMSNYDNGGGGIGDTTVYHNTLALQNACPNCANIAFQGLDAPIFANGSQWMEGENAGDPATLMSSGPGYVYAASNLTNLYNKPDIWLAADAIMNITQATRSIFWLNNDYIVVYDRATSQNSGLFKRFNLALVNNPVVAGNTATETMPDGQQLFIHTLLPANATFNSFVESLSPIADLEPTRFIFQVQDPTNPADTRFLHVLQGADAGAPMVPVSYLQSTAGVPFDGAVFGSSAVFFPVTVPASFTGTTLTAPAGVHTVLVTGLAPNGAYSVSILANGAAHTLTIANGIGSTADAAGVLMVSF